MVHGVSVTGVHPGVVQNLHNNRNPHWILLACCGHWQRSQNTHHKFKNMLDKHQPNTLYTLHILLAIQWYSCLCKSILKRCKHKVLWHAFWTNLGPLASPAHSKMSAHNFNRMVGNSCTLKNTFAHFLRDWRCSKYLLGLLHGPRPVAEVVIG